MRYDCVPRTQINTKRNQSIHRKVECSQIDWFILNTRLFDNVTQALSWILKALGIPSTLCGGRLVSRILLFSIPQPPSPAKYSCSQDTITTSFSVRNVRKQKKPSQSQLALKTQLIQKRIWRRITRIRRTHETRKHSRATRHARTAAIRAILGADTSLRPLLHLDLAR